MRTCTITLYQYAELPTAEAKTKALKWLHSILANDPPWMDEWRDVAQAIAKLSRTELVAIAARRDECLLTGFTGDYDALDAVLANPEAEDLHEIAYEALDRASAADLDYQLSDEALTEAMEANEYEFTADGARFMERGF